jgi:outer membrane protein assembly factor BamB
MTNKLHFYLLGLCSTLFLLTSCDTWLGEEKERLKGDRVSIIGAEASLKTDPDAQYVSIDLGDPDIGKDWPQVNSSSNHVSINPSWPGLNKIVWTESIGSGSRGSQVLLASPIAVEGIIYALDAVGRISAVNAKTGKTLWSKDLSEEPNTYAGGGLAFENGKIFATLAEGLVVALDSKDGTYIWKTKLLDPLKSAPTVYKGRLFVVATNNQLICLNAEKGDVLWRHIAFNDSLAIMGGASPAADGDVVMAPYSSGEVHALYAKNGYGLWSETLGSYKGFESKSMISQIKGAPVINKNILIAVSHSDQMLAIDLRTGQRIWEKPIGSQNTPAVIDEFIFLVTTHNELVCLTLETGRIIWVHPLPMYENPKLKKGRILWLGPIIAGGKLLIASSQGEAMSLSPQDGQVLETLKLPGAVFVSPIVYGEMAYFVTAHGELIAVQ